MNADIEVNVDEDLLIHLLPRMLGLWLGFLRAPGTKINAFRQAFFFQRKANFVSFRTGQITESIEHPKRKQHGSVSELLNIRVGQVDFVTRTIRLDPGTTKNQEGREVAIESGALLGLLRQCVEGKRPEDHVFTRGDKPICDFRKSWENLCTAAGVPALLFHDLRRTAARNLRAAGVPEEIIMRIAGWKTSSIFKRYAIVDKTDVRAALQQLERARQKPLDHTDGRSSTEPEYPPFSQLRQLPII